MHLTDEYIARSYLSHHERDLAAAAKRLAVVLNNIR